MKTIQQKFIPILFSTAMVQAILEGRKTMTRRIVAKNNSRCGSLLTGDGQGWHSFDFNGMVVIDGKKSDEQYLKVPVPENETMHRIFSKYSVGDVLWVRETVGLPGNKILYKADFTDVENAGLRGLYDFKFKPGIHMPKAACRIFLQVKSIRVERLQDISEEDAKAEGVVMNNKPHEGWYWMEDVYSTTCPILAYQKLWEKINGAESWDANPFVWCIEFNKIDKPGNFI